jgi:hypothetical protein
MTKVIKGLAAGLSLGLLVAALGSAQTVCECRSPGVPPSGSGAAQPEFRDLPGPGQKCWIGEVYYFVYRFVETPKTGPATLKIDLFDKSGARISDLDVAGRTVMPSLPGTYDSGPLAAGIDQGGAYSLPVTIAMPGSWEIRLTFSRNKIVLFRGRLALEV